MRRIPTRTFVVVALALAVGLASGAAPYASSAPDGLNRVAADQEFDGRGKLSGAQEDAPVPGYAFPGIADEHVARGAAGFAGTLAVFGAGYGVAWLVRRRRPATTLRA